MLLVSPEMAAPLSLIIRHLGCRDRAHLALTCRAASQAVLAEPLEAEVSLAPKGVTSFNAWLAKRVAAGAAPVRAVSFRGCSSAASQLEHEISAACHLSLCGTQRLELFEPCSYLLEAARGIRSLTRLFFTAFVPWCSLAPLDGMPQLRDLEAVLGIDGIQIEWSPRMPGLTALSLRNMGRITLCLDGLAALEQLVLYCDLHGDSDVAVETSRAVPQLKHLDVRCMRELALPWQRLVGLQELVLRGEPGGSIPCHSGCTHLRGLRSLRVDLKEVQLPPGPWLASVTRLMVLGAHKQGPELAWLSDAVLVKALSLCAPIALDSWAGGTLTLLRWAGWARSQPLLESVELQQVEQCLGREKKQTLCAAVRAEGESVDSVLGSLLVQVASKV